MLDIDALLRPYWESIHASHGPLDLFDAHTHIGANDPDGFKQSADELMGVMSRADARAVVFPMHEPAGYARLNVGTTPELVEEAVRRLAAALTR